MEYPRISIITPSYNQGKYIEKTILSVLNQGYPNLEYVIIDGGSTDETIPILNKYSAYFHELIIEKDMGQSAAMNKGLTKISGEIVIFLAADDIMMPRAFFKAAQLFSDLPETVGVIHGGVLTFDEHGNQRINYGHSNPTIEVYLSSIAIPFAATFIKKKQLDKVGLYDESLHYGMDYDLFARLALVCDFEKVNFLFIKYRLHSHSKSIKMEKFFIGEWIQVFKTVANNIGAKDILYELNKLNVFNQEPNGYKKYNFQFEKKQFDNDLLIFYFLYEVFCADYRNGNFSRARIIHDYLKEKYENLLTQFGEFEPMSNRLKKYPPLVFNLVRAMKKL